MIGWAVAVAGVSVLGYATGYALRAGRTCPRPGTRVALVGDSLAVGLAPLLGQHALDCGSGFLAITEGGTRSQQWTGKRLDEVEAFAPTVLLVSLGGNDFAHSDPEVVSLAVDRIVERAKEMGAALLWIMPPPMPMADASGTVAIWTARTQCRFPTHAIGFPQAADKIHPTPAGFRQLAPLIWQWVTSTSWHRYCGA